MTHWIALFAVIANYGMGGGIVNTGAKLRVVLPTRELCVQAVLALDSLYFAGAPLFILEDPCWPSQSECTSRGGPGGPRTGLCQP